MLIYLDHAWGGMRAKRPCRRPRAGTVDLYGAVMEGAVERVRPKMMTVVAIMAGLLPMLCVIPALCAAQTVATGARLAQSNLR